MNSIPEIVVENYLQDVEKAILTYLLSVGLLYIPYFFRLTLPLLSKTMHTLENSDDETQIKVALNLIKILIEHNISENTFTGVEDMITAVEDGLVERGNNRWYDIDTTVRTAINMLENSPEPVQKAVAKDMAKMVVEKIKEDADEIEDEEEV